MVDVGRHPFFTRGAYPPEYRLNRYLDDVGDGTGVKDHAVNYGASGADAFVNIQAPAGQTYCLQRMIVKIRGDNTGLSAGNYGDLSALTNGILVQVRESDGETLVTDLTDGVPIQANVDWARLCYDARPDDYGAGDNFVLVRWSFFLAGKSPIILAPGRRFGCYMSDDMSGLEAQFFLVQGFIIPQA